MQKENDPKSFFIIVGIIVVLFGGVMWFMGNTPFNETVTVVGHRWS